MAELLLALKISSLALDVWGKMPSLQIVQPQIVQPAIVEDTIYHAHLPYPDAGFSDPPSDYYGHIRDQQRYYVKMITGK
jgi:hypothetical protein